MRKALEIGGVVAAVVLIAFGSGAVVIGLQGRSTVSNSLKQEHIKGASDMTASQIAAEAKSAGITNVSLPTCSVANQSIDSGAKAYCFASYMRAHALLDTGGYTYSQMGVYQAAPNTPKNQLAVGGGTDNTLYAATDPKTGLPKNNSARDIWVDETALSTALNASYMGDKTAQFGIVVGIALLLTGIGFAILVASGAIRDPRSVLRRRRSRDLIAEPSVESDFERVS